MDDPGVEVSADTLDPLPLGATVGGRYTLRRVLGRGAAAVVIAAEHLIVRRQVALKLPLRDPELYELLAARLRRETRALARVRHPAVVDVIDAGEEDRLPFLAMELLEGRTLSGLITARGQLQWQEVVKVGIELAEGLSAVHAAGIVHRDVKPSNVLITTAPIHQVHLCDFGVAKTQETGSPPQPKLTERGALLGTPEYMPMEALYASEETDQRVDVYALGVTLFECLTGSVPVDGTPAEILLRVSSQPLPDVASVRADVPEGLNTIVARCLAQRPSERFERMDQIAAGLRGLLGLPADAVDLLRAPPSRQSARERTGARTPAAASSGAAEAPRREHARAPYGAVATLQTEGAGPWLTARIEDVSEGGALVFAETVYAAGTHVRLRFALPISGRVIVVPSTVRWTRKQRGAPATGLEFTALLDAARAEIRQYVGLMEKRAR